MEMPFNLTLTSSFGYGPLPQNVDFYLFVGIVLAEMGVWRLQVLHFVPHLAQLESFCFPFINAAFSTNNYADKFCPYDLDGNKAMILKTQDVLLRNSTIFHEKLKLAKPSK